MNCIKQTILGGNISELPSDIEFVQERGFNTVEAYLHSIWKSPSPCIFVWVEESKLEQIKQMDSIDFPFKDFKTVQSGIHQRVVKYHLLKVSENLFNKLSVYKQRAIFDGETGFLTRWSNG